jgi:hypothetical protein
MRLTGIDDLVQLMLARIAPVAPVCCSPERAQIHFRDPMTGVTNTSFLGEGLTLIKGWRSLRLEPQAVTGS